MEIIVTYGPWFIGLALLAGLYMTWGVSTLMMALLYLRFPKHPYRSREMILRPGAAKRKLPVHWSLPVILTTVLRGVPGVTVFIV